jgi:hypothetical protein
VPHDVEEAVLRIRLSERDEEDFVARYYGRMSIFTMKSAYKVALSIDQVAMRKVGSSSRADGGCSLYKEIWSAKVPKSLPGSYRN